MGRLSFLTCESKRMVYARKRPIPTIQQALARIDRRRAVTLLQHQMRAADLGANAMAEQRHIEHAIYGRISPGLRASLGHRHAALEEEIEANLL